MVPKRFDIDIYGDLSTERIYKKDGRYYDADEMDAYLVEFREVNRTLRTELEAELATLKESQERLNAEYKRDARTYSREQLIELRERINEAFLLNPYGKVFHVDRVEPDKFDITVDV